jgi:PAS domain-containing protein
MFIKKSKRSSDAIYNALPALLALSERWPLPSGSSSLVGEFERLDLDHQHTLAQLLALMDFSADALYSCSPGGACTHANKALCDLFEMDLSRMLENGWLEAVIPRDRLGTFHAWKEAVDNHIPYEAEYVVRTVESRREFPVKAFAFPLHDREGRVLSYLGVVRVQEITSANG